ncbi:Uncharacterised protein [Klebsiella pneumoniae]|nr:Uncharacterised protein [Klebsiella pneumoniae]
MIDIAIGRFLQGNSDRAGEVELPGMIAALQQPEPLSSGRWLQPHIGKTCSPQPGS